MCWQEWENIEVSKRNIAERARKESDCTNIKLSFWKLIHPWKFMLVFLRAFLTVVRGSGASTLQSTIHRSTSSSSENMQNIYWLQVDVEFDSIHFLYHSHESKCQKIDSLATRKSTSVFWTTSKVLRLLNIRQCRQSLKRFNYLHTKLTKKKVEQLWYTRQKVPQEREASF